MGGNKGRPLPRELRAERLQREITRLARTRHSDTPSVWTLSPMPAAMRRARDEWGWAQRHRGTRRDARRAQPVTHVRHAWWMAASHALVAQGQSEADALRIVQAFLATQGREVHLRTLQRIRAANDTPAGRFILDDLSFRECWSFCNEWDLLPELRLLLATHAGSIAASLGLSPLPSIPIRKVGRPRKYSQGRSR